MDRATLDKLKRAPKGAPRRSYSDIVEEAVGFRSVVVATVAAGVAAVGGAVTARDALLAGVDVLRDPLTEADRGREQLLDAIGRAYPDAYSAPDVVADRLAAMSEESVAGVMNAVKGAMFELRVAEMLDAGDLPLPDGAVSWEPTSFTTPGADGRFLDADGGVVGTFQIKASDDADLISEHLARYPQVDTVVTTREAAADAADVDGIVDTGISVEDLIPGTADGFADVYTTSFLETVGEYADDIPFVGLAFIAGELATTHLQGGDMAAALAEAKVRAGRTLTWSALGSGVAALTGLEPARLVVTVGGRAAAGWLGRAAEEQQSSVAGLDLVRQRLEALKAAPAVT